MTIQINSDKTMNWEKRNAEFFTSQIADALERHEDHITRIEVHLKDENGKKDGANDISCLLEARLQGKKPIAVTNQADTIDLAVSGAIVKIKTSIETIIGRNKKH